MTTHHDRTGQTEMRECGRGPCWLGDGHDGPCRPGGRPHPDEDAERTVDPAGESAEDAAVRWMIRAKEEQRRALKAEQERDHLRKVLDTTARQRDNTMRNDRPRPLTADDITDEMVKRALAAGGYSTEIPGNWDVMRGAITAALTEPPKRPDWIDAPAVLAWHKDDGCTGYDGTPGRPRIWSPDYGTTDTWSTPSLRNVPWADLVDVEPLGITEEQP